MRHAPSVAQCAPVDSEKVGVLLFPEPPAQERLGLLNGGVSVHVVAWKAVLVIDAWQPRAVEALNFANPFLATMYA
jgi:hypothetical protein